MDLGLKGKRVLVTGSTLGMLLGAHSFGEFSDRLEFMNQIAADDTDAVTRASVTGQRAR